MILVPPSGAIVGSSFLLSNEGWTIEGNKAASYSAGYEPYSRGALLNHYILGTEDKVNVRASGAADQSLWYFVAPSKFLGNLGISYGGQLQFSLSAFSGDFSKGNSKGVSELSSAVCVYHVYVCVAVLRVVTPFALPVWHALCAFRSINIILHFAETTQDFVVLLECAECDGPVGGKGGITLGYSVAALAASPTGPFTGSPLRVTIPLREQQGASASLPAAVALAGGWVKDPHNSLLPWAAASQCDLIQVLSRLSKVSILGDWTAWYETVGLDDVRIANTKGQCEYHSLNGVARCSACM